MWVLTFSDAWFWLMEFFTGAQTSGHRRICQGSESSVGKTAAWLATITSPAALKIGSYLVVGEVVAFVWLEVWRYVRQRPVKCGKWGPLVKLWISRGGSESNRWGQRRLATRFAAYEAHNQEVPVSKRGGVPDTP